MKLRLGTSLLKFSQKALKTRYQLQLHNYDKGFKMFLISFSILGQKMANKNGTDT
jgi:hypothetical protein